MSVPPGAMKGCRRDDQDGGVHQQRNGQGHRAVNVAVAQGFAASLRRARVVPGLHNGRVQIQVMRHHRSAQDADGDVEHQRIVQDARLRHKHSMERQSPLRTREKHLQAKADADGRRQRDDDGLNVAEAAVFQQQQQQHVKAGDDHADDQRDMKQQLQRDGRTDYLGQVAGGNRHLGQNPQHKRSAPSVALAAGLRQVAPGHHAQLQ